MKITAKAFGSELRSLREGKGLGLRELAKKARISPAFLSKVERGEVTPPAEKKLRSLAKVLDSDADALMAMAGRLPTDVLEIIKKHPNEYMELVRDLRNLSAEELRKFHVLTIEIPATPELASLFTKGAVEHYSWDGSEVAEKLRQKSEEEGAQ